MNTGLAAAQVSLLHGIGRPTIPSPTTCRRPGGFGLVLPPGLPREVYASHPLSRDLGVLGFALNSQARRNDRPNRVCQTATDWRFSSGCSPPRLAAAQLRSDTGFRPNLGGDFHPTDSLHLQAHESRLPPESASRLKPGLLPGTSDPPRDGPQNP